MKKLRLELDALRVDSFATADSEDGRGTVEGYISARCTGGTMTCNGGNTCGDGDTCNQYTCNLSDNGSCPCYPETAYEGSCAYTCNETCDPYPCTAEVGC